MRNPNRREAEQWLEQAQRDLQGAEACAAARLTDGRSNEAMVTKQLAG
jgi:hypothetical protein